MPFSHDRGLPYASRYNAYRPRAPPSPSAVPQQHRARSSAWPPPPSVQDEGQDEDHGVRGNIEGEPPMNTRGTIDQESLLDDIELPATEPSAAERRFVLLSGHSEDAECIAEQSTISDRRRKSFIAQGHMPHIQTDIEEPPVLTERISTPYAYTRPQQESTSPAPAALFRSPASRTPISTTRPGIVATGVLDEANSTPQNIAPLRTERQPARYSFVKNDLQTGQISAVASKSHVIAISESREPSQRQPHQPPLATSSNTVSHTKSSRSSPPSCEHGKRRPQPSSNDAECRYPLASHPPSRTSSPLQQVTTSKYDVRLRSSPPISNPSSRSTPKAASPPSPSSLSPSGRVFMPITDRHATYPPLSDTVRSSEPSSRNSRHETIPQIKPRIKIHNPSPTQKPPHSTSLPYPMDDPSHLFMPPEEHYQFDHSVAASYQQGPTKSMPGVSPFKSSMSHDDIAAYEPLDQRGAFNASAQPSSVCSTLYPTMYRDSSMIPQVPMSMDKPLPSCPRSVTSGRFNDWYGLQDHNNFDICPSCYEGVLAETSFAISFSQTRLHERPMERVCELRSPWVRLAWLLTIQQRRSSLGLFYALADINDDDRPCPGDRELGGDRMVWYGIADQGDGVPVTNFAICSCDKRMVEILLPSLRGYFTRLPATHQNGGPNLHVCSLRTTSRRALTYLDLLIELDAESQAREQRPDIVRFIQLARECAFKGECAKDKSLVRKPWHFIPSLPEFTVCEECYDEVVWPTIRSRSTLSSIPHLFNKSIQLVPGENLNIGSSCCLYSPRMRRIWETSIKQDDFSYLKYKAKDRKRMETRLARERKDIMTWMLDADRESSQWEDVKSELKDLEREWAAWE